MQNRYSLLIPETLIPNNSDLNDYTTPGQYYVSTAANSKTIKNCPYTLSGFKLTVEKTSSDGHILQTLKAVNEKYIYYRTAADSNFNDWLTPVTNADLRDIFSGRDNYIDTLSSIQQLTTPGFYKIDNISSAVNDNAGSNPLSDYATGDFYGLLMGETMNSTNGCRYGTLILTSPRLAGVLWVGNIWDYKFAGWYKK